MMSLFKYALPVWGCASYSTYLVNIDKLQNRAVKFGYLKYTTPINDLIESSDNTIWNNIKNNSGHPLAHLLPPQQTILRSRSLNFILPKIKTEHFKNVFKQMLNCIVRTFIYLSIIIYIIIICLFRYLVLDVHHNYR